MGALDDLDLSLKLSKEEESERLEVAWTRLSQLRLTLGGLIGGGELGPPVCVLFEGEDASGKGGAELKYRNGISTWWLFVPVSAFALGFVVLGFTWARGWWRGRRALANYKSTYR